MNKLLKKLWNKLRPPKPKPLDKVNPDGMAGDVFPHSFGSDNWKHLQNEKTKN